MNRRLSCSYVSNNLEHLESRRLLSTVDVTSFGAKPNDGGDDKAAIQAAINASQPGDTILFPAGTYNFSDQVFLKGNRTYQGAGDSTVLQGDPARDIFHIQESGVTIQNFKFIGQPIIIDGGTISNVVINNNTLQVTATGPNDNGITFTTLLTNSSITNNTFSPINGFAGIYGYFWNNVTIANNEFINGEQGMHFDNLDNNGQNLLIEQNYFSGLHRMGVEYQGGGHNLVLQDNYYENPNLSSNQADNGDTSAFSIVADQSTGTIARRNTIIAPQRPDGIGVRIDFETGGDGSQLYDNYVIGGSYFDANTDGNGTTSITTTNNHVENVLYQTLIGRGITASNNGPGVQVTWDINRGKP
ncbi:MAG TPA: glycosyl hydrolase family 28-related protein [Tepidisphaeraceae bacterium]|nr:glycosyl hydrolase family 28-related protein [Tepidisphaeraceae bacterium]